ncbi:hypothetical protein ACJJTC_005157 [Scirpophaga incertulas]
MRGSVLFGSREKYISATELFRNYLGILVGTPANVDSPYEYECSLPAFVCQSTYGTGDHVSISSGAYGNIIVVPGDDDDDAGIGGLSLVAVGCAVFIGHEHTVTMIGELGLK